jgi:hypothetical protein
MPKPTHPQQEQDLVEDTLENLEIESDDYGFVIGADGEIKAIFTPEGFYLDPPLVIKKILKVLGIKDINQLHSMDGNDTLH